MDSLEKIVAPIRKLEGVGDVKLQGDMVRSINATVNSLAIVLTFVAAALLLISFVLINNTVRLTVYARRFSIHTMKLVGAKGGFIRRPFLIVNAFQGIIAGILASGALALLIAWAHTFELGLETLLSWQDVWFVFVALPLAGVLICMLAAASATNRYLRKDYDDMFN